MPNNLVPTSRTDLVARGGSAIQLSRPTSKALARLEQRTLVRVATVQAESYVQTEKLREIDHLAREAMTGQAMLHGWLNTLDRGDPVLHEDLSRFVRLAAVGKFEIIADTIDTFCRESR